LRSEHTFDRLLIMTTPVTDLANAVEALTTVDSATLGHGESLVELVRAVERLEAVVARAMAAFDAHRSWEPDGARSAASWLSTQCHLPVAECRRRVRLGRQLRSMPHVERAWVMGEMSRHHVEELCRVRTPTTEVAFARDEAMLVAQAQRLSFRQFRRALAYWQQLADPDGVERDAEAFRAARRVHLSQTAGGEWFLDGRLDPISGAVVANGFRRVEQEMFDADWAEARRRLGDGASVSDLTRTPAQRRADALVEIVRRAGAMPPEARLPEPLFTILVGYETFAGRVCELANGTVVAPGSVVPWLSSAWIERVVFDGPDRVKNVGRRRRLFRGATRRAVEVRDRECFHPFCEEPAEDAEIDHVQPWAAGGHTTDDNGRAACGYHNRQRHRST
jgi:hypothetical protein